MCFPALVSFTFQAGKENAFKENFAAPEMNLFCSSIQKYSPKEEVTAALSQAAWWVVSHLWLPTCPGLQAAAWNSGSPRPRAAHLAEQPNNLHILCISLCSWHASRSCVGEPAGNQAETLHVSRKKFVKLNYLHRQLGWISSPTIRSFLTEPALCHA